MRPALPFQIPHFEIFCLPISQNCLWLLSWCQSLIVHSFSLAGVFHLQSDRRPRDPFCWFGGTLTKQSQWDTCAVSMRATYKALSCWRNDPNIFFSAASLEDHLVSPISKILWLINWLKWVTNNHCNVVYQPKYWLCCYHNTCSFSHNQVENMGIIIFSRHAYSCDECDMIFIESPSLSWGIGDIT